MVDPQIRRLASQLVGMDDRLRALETTPQLAHSSIDDHGVPVYDKDGNLASIIGKQEDGTWGAPPLAGPVPGPPSGVSAVGGAGIVHVHWDGTFAEGAAPLDFDAVEVLVDGALAGAMPDRDGGSITIRADQGTRYISARVRTLVPRHSRITSPVSVEVRAPAELLFDDTTARADQLEEDLRLARNDLDVARARLLALSERPMQPDHDLPDPPTAASGVGAAVGDIGAVRDAGGEPVSWWQWDGAMWREVEFFDTLVARIAQIMELSVGSLIVTEGATIDHLVALAIAGATAEFQEAFIQNLRSNGAAIDEAVIGDLAANIITSGMFRTAEDGQRVEIDENGLRQYSLDPEGNPELVLEITPAGASVFTVGAAQIDGEGNLVAQHTEVESLTVAGRDLTQWVSDGGGGVVARGWSTRTSEWDGSGTEIIRMHLTAPLRKGRLYSVTLEPTWVQTRGGAGTVIITKLLAGQSGESQVTSSSSRIAAGRHIIGANPNPVIIPQIVGWVSTEGAWFGDEEEREVAFGAVFRGATGTDYQIQGGQDPIRMVIRDEGPYLPASSWTNMGEGTPAQGGTTAPISDTTLVKRYKATIKASAAYAWNVGGGLAKSGLVVQGRYSGGVMRAGAWLFPDMTADLKGATVTGAKLRWYCSHTWYASGGTAGIWLHGKGGRTFSELPTWVATKSVRRGAWVEVDVPRSMLSGFVSGTHRGFGLQTSNTALDYYVNGRADAAIVLTYEK